MKETPWIFTLPLATRSPVSRVDIRSQGTYALVHVDGVLASDNILDGAALGLAASLLSGLGRHLCGGVISLDCLGQVTEEG